MRSRYAAFAMKRIDYLWKTLHADHPDRAEGEALALARLRRSASEHRYMGLTILDRAAPDAHGIARVLFVAKVFLKGRDVSFIECSDFAHDGVGWRYLAGVGELAAGLREGVAGLTIARFLER
jgi:SEC-C motif-containing protein